MNDLDSMNFLVRNPEEEFFKLAVLALKMLQNEEYDKSYQINMLLNAAKNGMMGS